MLFCSSKGTNKQKISAFFRSACLNFGLSIESAVILISDRLSALPIDTDNQSQKNLAPFTILAALAPHPLPPLSTEQTNDFNGKTNDSCFGGGVTKDFCLEISKS